MFTHTLLRGLRGEADADRDGIVTFSEVAAFVEATVDALVRLAAPPAPPIETASVHEHWLAALRRGDVRAASRYFALPSTFQNGTPVLTIDTDVERVAVNEALPCGAKAIRTGGAGAFTIIVFELVRRPGADCGPGTGNRARGAIRVAGGRIREWYRLPDAPGAAQPAPPAAGPAV